MELHSNSVSNRLSLSCFFCLRSNSRKCLNPQVENVEEEAVSSFHEFSLRNLYRFLNLLHSDKEERDFKDLKMPICEECFRLNGEFNKLYSLLEETKLRLHWCIQKMQDCMTKSRNKCRLSYQVELTSIEDAVDEEKVLDIWRTHTLDRMKEVTHATFPQVLIYKRSHAALNDCPHESNDEGISTFKRLRTQDEKDESSTSSDKTFAPQEVMIRSQSLPSSSSSSFLVDQEREKNVSNNIHDRNNIIGTEISCDTKLAVPCTDSSAIQKEIERKSHLRGRGKPVFKSHFIPVSSNVRAQFRCKACKTMINRIKAFEHLEHHCPKGPQRPFISPTATIKKQPAKSRRGRGRCASAARIKCSSMSSPSNCPYCSFKSTARVGMSARNSMANHLVRNHPEHYLIDEDDKAGGLWHEQFRAVLENMVYPDFILNENERHHRSCSSCGVVYKSSQGTENENMMKRHLIFHHKAELKEKLKIVMEDPSFEEKFIGLKKKSGSGTYRGTKNKYSSNCPYCPFKPIARVGTSSASGSMVNHLICYHPEHFLIDENDKASGLWHEQFPSILENMVYPNFVLNEGHHRSCASCGAQYKSSFARGNEVSLKRHIFFHHKTELKEKLKMLLEDPSLEEKHHRSRNLKKGKALVLVRKKYSRIGGKYSANCTYCSFKSNSSSSSDSAKTVMVSHLVRFHPEHYLIDDNDRASGLWHEQFPTILTNMVYPSFISKKGHHRSCSSCGAVYRSVNATANAFMMKRHLIFHHKAKLKEKFKNILEDPALKLKLKGYNLKNGAPGRTSYCRIATREKFSSNCPYCHFKCGGKDCNRKNSIVKHLVQFHPEHFLVDKNERDQVPQQLRAILTDTVLPKFVRKTGKHTSCMLCGMKYQSYCVRQNGVSVRKHLIFHHKALIKDELRKFDPEEMKEMSTKTDGEQQINVQCVASTSRDSQKHDVDFSAKCPYCRYQCDTPNILELSIENHLVRFHPEHFLMEEDKSISRHPEFQRILSDMIFPKFLLITGHQTQCSLCDMKYTVGKRHENVVLLKKHLLLQHSTELKKSIKCIMEDPTLEEKLDSCCADGVTCSCGVYFAPLEQQARRFHENFHCIPVRNTEQSQEEKVQCSPHANKEMERKQMKFDERRSTGVFGLGEVDLLELD